MSVGRTIASGAAVVALTIAILPVTSFGQTASQQDIDYVPLRRSAFVQEPVAQAWVDHPGGPDDASIWGHAWDIWREVNRPSGQRIEGTPITIWETWYSGEETFLDNQEVDDPGSRDLDPPNQSVHAGALEEPVGDSRRIAASVLSFNRYNRQMVDHIVQNGYYDRAVLQQLVNGFDQTAAPPETRVIADFPNTSVMVKPVWWIVPGDAPSMMPYWAGETADVASDTANPSWQTWKQCVLVDPTGEADNDIARTCNEGEAGETKVKAGGYEVFRIDSDPTESDFYAFRLTQDEVDALGQFKMILDNTNKQAKVDEVEAGDMAILTAAHVSTREISDWTWQSYWWAPDPSRPAASPPNAQRPPASIPAPFDHFNMCAAYYMTTPVESRDAGEPWICFNPYLETDLEGLFTADRSVSDDVGIHSNCQSCHRAAVYTATKQIDYVSNGYVAKSDPSFFGSGLITGFLWSMPFRAHDGPFVGLPRPAPSSRPTTATKPPATTTTEP